MSEQLVIIDYGSGNLRSVEKAFERATAQLNIAGNDDAPIAITVTDDARLIAEADRIVLPGVGAFGACMDGLRARPGVIEALEGAVLVGQRPFLGICVGMQLLADRSAEFGDHAGLGWVAGKVSPLAVEKYGLRTPHMGWSEVSALPGAPTHPVLSGLDGEAFYFAHSYHFEPENSAVSHGVCQYGSELTAFVARDNIAGVQFHPEKSQRAGIALLRNFLTWMPS